MKKLFLLILIIGLSCDGTSGTSGIDGTDGTSGTDGSDLSGAKVYTIEIFREELLNKCVGITDHSIFSPCTYSGIVVYLPFSVENIVSIDHYYWYKNLYYDYVKLGASGNSQINIRGDQTYVWFTYLGCQSSDIDCTIDTPGVTNCTAFDPPYSFMGYHCKDNNADGYARYDIYYTD